MQNSFLDALEPTETPPPGCAPDAIKLFVGNVPKTCTEEQLLPLFQSVGKVVELVIVHDKVTHESKGSAFVWYASRADAERAILQFNFRHVLPDPSGDQDRPLVVRRAKARAKPLKPAVGLLGALPQGAQPRTVATAQPFYSTASQNLVGLAGLEALQLGDAANLSQLSVAGSLPQQGGVGGLGMGSLPPYRSLASLTGQGMGGQPGQGSVYDAYVTGDQLLNDINMTQSLQRNAAAAAAQFESFGYAQSATQQQQQIAQSMTMNQSQLTLLNTHLFSIQTVSGAQLHISPGAPGLFNLVVSGSKAQVETAKGLITTVLSHA
ncbi:hypothetical protein GPECTOR_1g375 [Gonium pectorale]|uniref:RRM domain-containing protein n=1 Tax=Gonium pectorale TaxID=33097 RepID=A0A150H2X1_GONPE|nr:hypothetical protein GPECTOR_1g375 [Gonium pectorale]|eukprot:KXZ56421.1 hypothetical protein GPECTOR_1g375 [Gonium pectorale]